LTNTRVCLFLPLVKYRMSNVEPQKYFEIRHSLFDILRFIKLPGYLFTWNAFRFYRLRSGPFEGPASVKPSALPEVTCSRFPCGSRFIGRSLQRLQPWR
jgi:hypothetical protein